MTMAGQPTPTQMDMRSSVGSALYNRRPQPPIPGKSTPDKKMKLSPGSSTSLPKIDPSFKSKRYRDKLRTEIKALESLLPVDRKSVHRKLDSQTVFRLSIGYFRTKLFLQAAGLTSLPSPCDIKSASRNVNQDEAIKSGLVDGCPVTNLPHDSATWEDIESMMQALDGYLLAVTSDGTILYVSENILQHLGFNQVDLIMRCMYGIVHPDDHQELKVVLEQTLTVRFPGTSRQRQCCATERETDGPAPCRTLSFLCRMKCFNGTTTGYLKMQCVGHMRAFPHVTKSQRTSNHVLFAFCRPFLSMSTDPCSGTRSTGFWTKHDLDMKFKQMEAKVTDALGYVPADLEMTSFYEIIHPEDLLVVRNCHTALVHSDEIQTMYFRVQHKDGSWVWLHTRGKVVFRNSKKYSLIFTHCPVREEDSTYIQQEALLRQLYSIQELMYGRQGEPTHNTQSLGDSSSSHRVAFDGTKEESNTSFLHDPHGQCPSSWHTTADRHSPVFPQHHLPHQPHHGHKKYNDSHYGSNRDAQHPGWYGQNNYQQTGYAPLSLWNVPAGRYNGYDIPSEEHWSQATQMTQDNSNFAFNPKRKEYYMRFNGVGFSSHDVTHIAPQYPSSTLFIQGHVTAYEGEARSAPFSQDACAYSRLPVIGQYPTCNRADCTYGALTYKNRYQPGAAESGENPYNYAQSQYQTRSFCVPTNTSAHDLSIKQENRETVMAGGNAAMMDPTGHEGYPYDVTMTNEKHYIQRCPDLAPVSNVSSCSTYDMNGKPASYV